MAGEKIYIKKPLKGRSSQLFFLLFFFLMSIAVPLPSRGQNSSPLKEGPRFNTLEVIEEKNFLILKERLDRLSRQITKHKSPSGLEMPKYIEKEGLNLPPFPEMTGDDGIEDRLLILKNRLETLHHLLQQGS